MEQNHEFKSLGDNPEIRVSSSGFNLEQPNNSNQETRASCMEEDESKESLADLMVWDSGARLVPSGYTIPCSTEEIMFFVNAGSITLRESDSRINFMADNFFEGGDTVQTGDFISEGGDCSFIYQSARIGNFCYRFENLLTGDYLVDLHFCEIININGPKGMRVFNVFMQDEKVLSDFDIFSIVGFNKPLQLSGARVAVKDDGILLLRFEKVFGSPMVSGICVRRAHISSVSQPSREYFMCTNCSTHIEYPSAQRKVLRTKSVAKYEKDIQDLKDMLKMKTDECYQSWMSWSEANKQLQKIRMDLDNKTFQTYSQDQTLEKQSEKLRNLASKYEQDQKSWTEAISNLEQKVKIMKQEHSELSREAHDCADSIPDLNKMVFAVQALVEQCEDLKQKYNEEQMKRRKLHNQLQESKGNIRVFCRCRPLSKSEVLAGCASVVEFEAAKDGDLGILVNSSTKKSFKFDRVYTPKDDQIDVFSDAAPMVVSVLDGYNVCIFAYGQTGTGKTFTMEGTEANRGVNYRTLEELFKITDERTETNSYSISVSVLEVYNEQIRDLLASETKKLEVKQTSEGSNHIPGIVEAKVDNIQQVWNVLQAGSSARAVGSNNVNEHSSRSHCMLCITVRSKNLISGECNKSKLWLVDLAGSERLAKTDVQGDRLKEAQNINRSLSALGDVISALANKSSHIPYRNSKLTHILHDSLGGDSKTLMFVQISPSDQDLSETLSSLNFATRVRGVELGPVRKQIDTNEFQKMKTMLEKARQECKSKEESLKRLEENLHNVESKAKGKDQIYKNQLEKIKGLESQVVLKESTQSQFEKQILHLTEKLKVKEESCSTLQLKAVELENKLKHQEENHSTIYQKKVNDLEKTLKDQMQHSESSSLTLQQKIKELERKLAEQDENVECLSLRQKIKELENKVREQEQQIASIMTSASTNQLNSTPMENKLSVREEVTNEAEHRILRSSNLANRRGSHGSAPVKENELPLHQVGKKRLSRNSEVENNGGVSEHTYKGRRSDPPKPATGVSRTTKPSITGQRPVARIKTTRDPVQGVKERDSKKRMWTR